MSVRFAEDFIPVDDPPFLPRYNAAVNCFSDVTIDMARRFIDANATKPDSVMRRVLDCDLRRLLDLMEWCRVLPTTSRTMPWFYNSSRDSSSHLFHHCHVCLKGKYICKCTATERDERVAAIVLRDWQRLDLILHRHRLICLCREGGFNTLTSPGALTSTSQSLVVLERAISPAWTKAMNSEFFHCLFLGKSNDSIPLYVKMAMAQMNAYLAFTTKQPPHANGDGRGLPVLARLAALDMAVDKKSQVRRELHSYLNNVHLDGDSATLCWVPQREVLHGALRVIEKYERGMQCTLLALAVAKVFQKDPQRKANQVNFVMYFVATVVGVAMVFPYDQKPKVNNIMCIVVTSVMLALDAAKAFQQDQERMVGQAGNAMTVVVKNVHPFLVPPSETEYDEAYLLEWWNMSS